MLPHTSFSAEAIGIFAAIIGYGLGSVPFGLVLTKICGFDLRNIGSGNIGATNVLRTGRKDLAFATLLLDTGKGGLAALGCMWLWDTDAGLISGCTAVLGHNFPLWLRFKGGKGVATTLGVLLVTAWPVGLLTCAIWAGVAAITRYSSLSALCALGSAPFLAWFLTTPHHGAAFGSLAALAFIRHRNNIRQLWCGTEPRIGNKASPSTDCSIQPKEKA